MQGLWVSSEEDLGDGDQYTHTGFSSSVLIWVQTLILFVPLRLLITSFFRKQKLHS